MQSAHTLGTTRSHGASMFLSRGIFASSQLDDGEGAELHNEIVKDKQGVLPPVQAEIKTGKPFFMMRILLTIPPSSRPAP